MDQVLSKESHSHSSTFVLVNSNGELGNKFDNNTNQLATLSTTLSSTHNIIGNRDEVGGRRGSGGGRNTSRRGKKKRCC